MPVLPTRFSTPGTTQCSGHYRLVSYKRLTLPSDYCLNLSPDSSVLSSLGMGWDLPAATLPTQTVRKRKTEGNKEIHFYWKLEGTADLWLLRMA